MTTDPASRLHLRRLHALREENELRLLEVEAAIDGLTARLENARRLLFTQSVERERRDSIYEGAGRLGELYVLSLRLRHALRRDDDRIARLTARLRGEALRS